MKTVHVLVGGQALCGKEGTPNTWEKTHLWVSRPGLKQFQEGEPMEGVEICPDCARAVAGMEA